MGTVLSQRRGDVTVVTLDRPDKLNAINQQMALDLQAAFVEFEASDARAAVLTGSGDRAFSAGADLNDMPEFWRCCPGIGYPNTKPIVAAVSGWCVGGGLVLSVFSDLAVASSSARFSYPEAKIGFTGGIGASLAARVPHKIAMELLLLGDPIDAQRAQACGLVNDVVPVGSQVEAAVAIAGRIAGNAPLAVRTLKHLVDRDLTLHSAAETAAAFHVNDRRMRDSADIAEGAAAFAARRPPRFLGR